MSTEHYFRSVLAHTMGSHEGQEGFTEGSPEKAKLTRVRKSEFVGEKALRGRLVLGLGEVLLLLCIVDAAGGRNNTDLRARHGLDGGHGGESLGLALPGHAKRVASNA